MSDLNEDIEKQKVIDYIARSHREIFQHSEEHEIIQRKALNGMSEEALLNEVQLLNTYFETINTALHNAKISLGQIDEIRDRAEAATITF